MIPPRSTSTGEHSIKVLTDFLGTVALESGIDRIGAPEGLTEWFSSQNMLINEPIWKDELRRAQDLREAIREVILTRDGTALDPAAALIVGDVWERAQMDLAIEQGALPRLVPASKGVTAGLGILAAHLLMAMRSNGWDRLKVCENPQCQRVFYDRSRNRSARWCAMASCGNRNKVRAYRLRQRMVR